MGELILTAKEECLVDAIQRGIKKANRKLHEWSEYWLCDYGVEPFMNTFVAQAIMKCPSRPKWLNMEERFDDVLETGRKDSNCEKNEEDEDNEDAERRKVDLALYDEDKVSCLIELKRCQKGRASDLKRLKELSDTLGDARTSFIYGEYVAGNLEEPAAAFPQDVMRAYEILGTNFRHCKADVKKIFEDQKYAEYDYRFCCSGDHFDHYVFEEMGKKYIWACGSFCVVIRKKDVTAFKKQIPLYRRKKNPRKSNASTGVMNPQ